MQKSNILSLIALVTLICLSQSYKDSKTYKPLVKNIDPIVSAKCQSPERNSLDNCACPENYFDDKIHDECQLCPYPCTTCFNNTANACVMSVDRLWITLDQITSQESVDNLHNFLVNEADIFNGDFELTDFVARDYVHSKSIQLNRPDPIYFDYTFFARRVLKVSDIYWKFTSNKDKLQPVVDFILEADIFEHIGQIAIIINAPDADGVEHADHTFNNLVSEFIWIRGNRDKQFYVVDKNKKERQFFSSYIHFFDDKLIHNIGITPMWDYSIRFNGKFKPWVREYIKDHYSFNHNEKRRNLFYTQDLKRNYTEAEGVVKLAK